ncbi:MAG TPA: hypothetical protein VGN69_08725 [Solirubrobacteraceae bacterium]|jgi:hypothetical protein|nr:hypothetical protein [Solirubrobacteraceae bacterium]
MRLPYLVGLCAVAALSGGCAASTQTSAGNFKGEQAAIARVIDDLGSASSGRDAKKVCSTLLDPALVTRLHGEAACERAVTPQLQAIDNFSLKVEPNGIAPAQPTAKATARVRSTRGGIDHVDTLSLVKVSGAWHLSGLGPGA